MSQADTTAQGPIHQPRRLALEGDLGPVPATVVELHGGEHPGLVVIHDTRGVDEGVIAALERCARAGFVAIAPHLDHRAQGRNPRPERGVVAELDDLEAMVDINAAITWLAAHPGCSGRIGALGAGAGGRWAVLLATGPIAPERVVACAPGALGRGRTIVDAMHPQVPLDRLPFLAAALLVVAGADVAGPDAEEVAELERGLATAGATGRVVSVSGTARGVLAAEKSKSSAGPAWTHALTWLEPLSAPRPSDADDRLGRL